MPSYAPGCVPGRWVLEGQADSARVSAQHAPACVHPPLGLGAALIGHEPADVTCASQGAAVNFDPPVDKVTNHKLPG